MQSDSHPNRLSSRHSLTRQQFYYWTYVSIFGVVWGIGTGVVAGALPPEPITRSIVITWLEVTIIVLAKVVLLRRFAVTHALCVASVISIFTFSFGPPNPYKPLFILAGLAFDASTGFRTTTLRYYHLVLGFIGFVAVAYPIFAVIIYLIDPGALKGVVKFIPIAALIYLIQGVIIPAIIWPVINPEKAPVFVTGIRKRVGSA